MSGRQKRVTKIKTDYVHQYDAQMARKQRRKKKLIQRLVIVGMMTVLILGVITTYHFKQRSVQADKQEQYNQLTEEIVQLELEEKELVEEINLLNDEEYILDIARTNYFLSKKGELIFQVDDEDERSY